MKSGAVTFTAFVLIGMIPLLPLLITPLGMPLQIYVSAALAGVVFFAIGSLKSLVFGGPTIDCAPRLHMAIMARWKEPLSRN
jgi:hypothetical protein